MKTPKPVPTIRTVSAPKFALRVALIFIVAICVALVVDAHYHWSAL